MQEVLTSIDNREIATAIWLAVFLCWCLSRPNTRNSFMEVLVAATASPIAIVFGLAFLYLIIVTIALQSIGLWTAQQLKITMLWFAVAGIPALADTPKMSSNPSLFKASIVKNFKLSLLLDFFINLFKLPVVAELVFVPFTGLICGMLVVAQSDKKNAPAQKLLNGILVLIGGALLVFETYKLITSYESIITFNTLRDFVLPIAYNLAFIPLLCCIAVYAAYESVFCRLGFVIKDTTLHSYARRKLILEFRTDIVTLNCWFKEAWFRTFVSRSDIAQSIIAKVKSRDVLQTQKEI